MDRVTFHAMDLHDATVLRINIDWPAGTAVVNLRTASGLASIACVDVTQVELSHQFPWGPSASIDRVQSDNDSVTVHMQSGDLIQITANRIALPGQATGFTPPTGCQQNPIRDNRPRPRNQRDHR